MASSSKKTSIWFFAGVCAFIVMCIFSFDWFFNVFLDWFAGLFGGSVNLNLGWLTTITSYAGAIAILIAAWCFVVTTLKRKTFWVVLYIIFAVLLVCQVTGLWGRLFA